MMTANTIRDQAIEEFQRVFGAVTIHDDEQYNPYQIRVSVPGWPEPQTYEPQRAWAVLTAIETGHGTTEAGDAEVCKALDDANARCI